MWSRLELLLGFNLMIKGGEQPENNPRLLEPRWQLLVFLNLADQEIKALSAGCPIKWA